MFRSEFQTFLKLCLSLASFNFFVRVTVKLSVIAIFFPFNFFLFSKIFFLSFYLTSLMIIGLGFSSVFLGFPIRCVLSISQSLIPKSKCSFIALIHSSSVSSRFFREFHVVAGSCALNIALVFPQILRGHLLFVLI